MKSHSARSPDAADLLPLAHRDVAELHRRAQMGDLTLMLAHELNNLMTPLLARAEFALKRGKPQDHGATLERVLVQARRANDLAQRLIDYSQARTLDFESRPVQPLWEEALATLPRPLEKDGINLSASIDQGLTVRTSGDLLVQVLFNLIVNARDALANRSGSISCAAFAADEDSVIIRVTDTGPGIPAAQLEDTYNPFLADAQEPALQSESRKCIGLGLRVCRYIVHLHHGSIRMGPNQGAGLAVELRLPSA